jgi:hypothetical protein
MQYSTDFLPASKTKTKHLQAALFGLLLHTSDLGGTLASCSVPHMQICRLSLDVDYTACGCPDCSGLSSWPSLRSCESSVWFAVF